PGDATADIRNVSKESASSGNVGCAHVDHGIRPDHSASAAIVAVGNAKAGIAGSGESAADVKSEVGARINRSAVAVVDQDINGTGCEVSSRCDGNIPASSDM